MKCRISILLLLVLVMTLFVACKEEPETNVVGKWTNGEESFTFSDDNIVQWTDGTNHKTGSWDFAYITFTSEDVGVTSDRYVYLNKNEDKAMTRTSPLEGEDSSAIDNMFETTGYECETFTFGNNGVGIRLKEEGSNYVNYYTYRIEDGVGTLEYECELWKGDERACVLTMVQTFAGHLGAEGDKYYMLFDNPSAKASYTEEYPYLLADGKLVIKYYSEPFNKVVD